MKITYDAVKNMANQAKHGISFERIHDFDWSRAVIVKDERKDYGEKRRRAIGYIGNRLYVFVYTVREGGIRAISLRKANDRERKQYE